MVFVGLIHYPVYNKHRKVVCTSLTPLDIHDIARASRTFGVEKYYVINPIDSHLELAKTLVSFWQDGHGRKYNPARYEALKLVKPVPYLEDALKDIEKNYSIKPKLVATTARKYDNAIDYKTLREKIKQGEDIFLCFGTGWGLTEEFIKSCDYILKPIYGPTDYNHLSVRSAVSIILDRLLGV